MKASDFQKNIMQKFIMSMFASNMMNSQEDTDKMIEILQARLRMSKVEAISLIKESIALVK